MLQWILKDLRPVCTSDLAPLDWPPNLLPDLADQPHVHEHYTPLQIAVLFLVFYSYLYLWIQLKNQKDHDLSVFPSFIF